MPNFAVHQSVNWRLATLLVLAASVSVSRCHGQETADQRFQKLADETWAFTMQEDPLWATSTGEHKYNDRLPQLTIADEKRRAARKQNFLDRAHAIATDQLSAKARTDLRIYVRLLENELAEFRFHSYLIPISNRDGFHINFPEVHRQMPFDTVEQFEHYIARLGQFSRYASQHIEMMREGIKTGSVLPSIVLERYREPIEVHIVEDATTSLMYAPLREIPDSISPDDQRRLGKAAKKAILESVVPGYRDFLRFMENEYVPVARGSIAASALPEGREFYRHRVRKFTTLEITPEEVHALGHREVQRIRREMQEIIDRIEFAGDFPAFLNYLRTDARFYAKTPDDLLKEVALVLKRIDGQLPKLFGRLPRAPYGIRKIPEYIAPTTTTAYYMPASGDGREAGFYYVNTYNLKSRPLYEVEALSFHEAVPGHHLQISLQQEHEDLPLFRRHNGFTAFVEGWALYAERLGLEAGFYEDPYSDFGRLTYEIWRACRLVVDTGIHYLGWTRRQAIEFMKSHSALAEHNIRSEVDRYIAWPGQALAYKMGELKIRELRTFAEQELGNQFDVRAFHDAVLAGGSVPLDVLEDQIREFISQAKQDSTP